MKVRVKVLADGPGPSDAIVSIATAAGGSEQVVVHKPALRGDALEVGGAVAEAEDRLLVELPRESFAGNWRVWITTDSIVAAE